MSGLRRRRSARARARASAAARFSAPESQQGGGRGGCRWRHGRLPISASRQHDGQQEHVCAHDAPNVSSCPCHDALRDCGGHGCGPPRSRLHERHLKQRLGLRMHQARREEQVVFWKKEVACRRKESAPHLRQVAHLRKQSKYALPGRVWLPQLRPAALKAVDVDYTRKHSNVHCACSPSCDVFCDGIGYRAGANPVYKHQCEQNNVSKKFQRRIRHARHGPVPIDSSTAAL